MPKKPNASDIDRIVAVLAARSGGSIYSALVKRKPKGK